MYHVVEKGKENTFVVANIILVSNAKGTGKMPNNIILLTFYLCIYI